MMQNLQTRRVPLSRPSISDVEKEFVLRALESGRLAMGPETAAFENGMAALCGTSHAVAVSSGTAALHLIVRALGLGPGDEVVTTPYSFVASANVLLYEGVKPVFVDVDPATYNIDVNRVEAAITPRTRAILAVDVFGLPAAWTDLTNVAIRHDLLLIDDACEGLGAHVDDRPLGSWGAAAAFGFYPNKQITTGEGGCITTNDPDLAGTCRSMRNQGRANDRVMSHVRLGYNYRMDELSAALGNAQLSRHDELAAKRREVAELYSGLLRGAADLLQVPPEPQKGQRSWFVYVVELSTAFDRNARNLLIDKMAARGIECAPYFPSIHLQPFYRDTFGFAPGAFPHAEAAADRTLALPLYADLDSDDIHYVVENLTACLAEIASERPADAL